MTPVVRRNCPVLAVPELDAAVPLEAGEGLPVGTEHHVAEPITEAGVGAGAAGLPVGIEHHVAEPALAGPECEPILAVELPEISPLPAPEVGLARIRPQEVEETAKPPDLVIVPGGQGEAGAGGVHGPAQLLVPGAEGDVGLVGLAAGRGLLRPCELSPLPCCLARVGKPQRERRGKHQHPDENASERGDRRVAPGPSPVSLDGACPAGSDRLVGQEPPQVFGQRQGARVTSRAFLFQAFQADRFQVDR